MNEKCINNKEIGRGRGERKVFGFWLNQEKREERKKKKKQNHYFHSLLVVDERSVVTFCFCFIFSEVSFFDQVGFEKEKRNRKNFVFSVHSGPSFTGRKKKKMLLF